MQCYGGEKFDLSCMVLVARNDYIFTFFFVWLCSISSSTAIVCLGSLLCFFILFVGMACMVRF